MDNKHFFSELRMIVGRKHVHTSSRSTERFRKGFRSGEGAAICVVRPLKLIELWRILELCVKCDKIVIMQAANTGLTEGSTPSGIYERDVVVINTLRMNKIIPLHEGKQILSFPGASLFDLEKLLDPLGREPHSVIGSSCIGASIVGGVCNNSGGSLVERGPVYTEMALYAKLNDNGQLELVNHLGIELGETPEDILEALETGRFNLNPVSGDRKASSTDYAQIVRNVHAQTPARFNADKSKLYEASGSAGKLAVFAVRLDSFQKSSEEKMFYIGTNSIDELTQIRRHILTTFDQLPVSAEYMHRDAFDLTEKYGKDILVLIDKLGTPYLPKFFAWKGAIDARLRKIPFMDGLSDKILQVFANLYPKVLPKRIREFRNRFEHHLLLKVKGEAIEQTREYLQQICNEGEAEYFECDPRENKLASLHRFAAAGAAMRYKTVHERDVSDIIALDIALRRNDREWLEKLPEELDHKLSHKLYYGHFMCHVMHQDYIVKKGYDAREVKREMLALLDKRGAKYPAEHNVGHMYFAEQDLQEHYKCCDPTNSFNPGIGKMSKKKYYN